VEREKGSRESDSHSALVERTERGSPERSHLSVNSSATRVQNSRGIAERKGEFRGAKPERGGEKKRSINAYMVGEKVQKIRGRDLGRTGCMSGLGGKKKTNKRTPSCGKKLK